MYSTPERALDAFLAPKPPKHILDLYTHEMWFLQYKPTLGTIIPKGAKVRYRLLQKGMAVQHYTSYSYEIMPASQPSLLGEKPNQSELIPIPRYTIIKDSIIIKNGKKYGVIGDGNPDYIKYPEHYYAVEIVYKDFLHEMYVSIMQEKNAWKIAGIRSFSATLRLREFPKKVRPEIFYVTNDVIKQKIKSQVRELNQISLLVDRLKRISDSYPVQWIYPSSNFSSRKYENDLSIDISKLDESNSSDKDSIRRYLQKQLIDILEALGWTAFECADDIKENINGANHLIKSGYMDPLTASYLYENPRSFLLHLSNTFNIISDHENDQFGCLYVPKGTPHPRSSLNRDLFKSFYYVEPVSEEFYIFRKHMKSSDTDSWFLQHFPWRNPPITQTKYNKGPYYDLDSRGLARGRVNPFPRDWSY
jgi:hypothetical protein